jgi:CO/xanthine dehydrogenase Mo-binding subunit
LIGNSLKYVGQRIPNIESISKVCGKLHYTGDMILPGMLHAKLLHSPFPHARVKSIRIDKAEKLRGVKLVSTCFNSPQSKYCSDLWSLSQDKKEDEYLFPEIVRYIGDRVGSVVAETPEIAKYALGLIEVEYEEFPFLLNIKEAMDKGDQAGRTIETTIGDMNDGMETAGFQIEDVITTQKVYHCTIEPHTCLADCDSEGRITVWCSSQNTFGVRLIVSKIMQLPLSKVRVIKTPSGGSFGSRLGLTIEPVVAYLAWRLRRPVRLELDREECITSTTTRHPVQFQIRSGVKKGGELTALQICAASDTGAYTINAEDLLRSINRKAFRLYRVKNMAFHGQALYTNTVPSGIMRGYGSPQIFSAIEIHMNHVAKQIGIDPVQFRLKNLVHSGDLDPVTGKSLGGAHIIHCVELGAKKFGWEEKKKAVQENGTRIFRRGIGIACCCHPNGYYGICQDFSTMTLRLNEDGSLALITGLHDLGSGSKTIMQQIVGEILKLDPSLIEVFEADTKYSPYDIGTQASRTAWVSGNAAVSVAEALKVKILEVAGVYLHLNPKDLELSEGYVRKQDHSVEVPLREIGIFAQGRLQKEIVATESFQSVANPYSYAAHFAEVEVDTETGQVKVLYYLAAHDIGKAINPMLVEGQIYGGVQMGLGLALSEEIKIDPSSGSVVNRGLQDYIVLGPQDMPPINVLLVEVEEEHGPFGAKGIGEIATAPVAAAVVNAVNNALDTNINRLPLTPERIITALHGTREF